MRAYVRNVMQGGAVVAPNTPASDAVRYRTRTPVARASRVHAQSREEYAIGGHFRGRYGPRAAPRTVPCRAQIPLECDAPAHAHDREDQREARAGPNSSGSLA